MTTPTVKLLTGDAYEKLDELKPQSVDCCWASPNPPMMFQGPDVVVGTEQNIDDYILHLVSIFNKVLPLLKDTGSLWIRIGDYHSNVGQLNCAPARLQLALSLNGWVPLGDITWQRDDEDYPETGLKYEPPKTRFLRNNEHMLWFTKQPRGYYFSKKYVDDLGLNLNSVWHWPYDYDDNPSHIPHQIVDMPIKVTCPPNGVILDPFHGRGNTMQVALKNGMHYVGIEILPQRVEESLKKLKGLGLEHRMVTTTA